MQELKLEKYGRELKFQTNSEIYDYKHHIQILDNKGVGSIMFLEDKQLIELRNFLNLAIKETENATINT